MNYGGRDEQGMEIADASKEHPVEWSWCRRSVDIYREPVCNIT